MNIKIDHETAVPSSVAEDPACWAGEFHVMFARVAPVSATMTLGQAVALLETVEAGTQQLVAYVVLSLLAGVRTEEARAITWDEVDLKAGTVAVFRSVRVKGAVLTRRPLDRWQVGKEFQKITRATRLGGAWMPRELRPSFVSILSAHDVGLEDISDGHEPDSRDQAASSV